MNITEETLSQEFRRLIEEYRSDTDGKSGSEAWNLIADFAVDNSTTISAALEGTMSSAPTPPAPVPSVGEPVAWIVRDVLYRDQVFLDRQKAQSRSEEREMNPEIVPLYERATLAPVPAREATEWVLVPREITTDMMGAFHHAKRVFSTVPEIWNHILAAAPTALAPAPLFTIRDKTGEEPCGECHIQPGETCDICGASRPANHGEPK